MHVITIKIQDNKLEATDSDGNLVQVDFEGRNAHFRSLLDGDTDWVHGSEPLAREDAEINALALLGFPGFFQ